MITEEEIAALYVIGKGKEIETGQTLIREGDPGDTAFIILDGSLQIIKTIDGEEGEIARLNAGDWVGEIALTRGTKRTASAVALEPTTVIEVNKEDFDGLSPDIKLSFFKKLNDISGRRFNEQVNDIFSKLKAEAVALPLVTSLETALKHYMKSLKTKTEAMEQIEQELSVTSDNLREAMKEKVRLYAELEKYTQKLEKKVVELEIKIDEKKRTKDVESITETDYFRILSDQAEELRNE